MSATGRVTVNPDDEYLDVEVDGSVVFTADHDEHGWSGIDAVKATALAVGQALATVTITEASIDAFKRHAHPAPLEPNIRPALTAFLRELGFEVPE